MTNASAVLILAVPAIAWRVSSRVRRLVKRQQSIAWRHWTASAFFPLLGMMLGFAAWSNGAAFAALVVGAAIGAGLGLWGLRLTRFENTSHGLYFTPNAYLGLAVSLLLVCRILYRLVEIAVAGEVPPAGQNVTRNPSTLLVFGVLSGYYTLYSIGLLRERRKRAVISRST
jgi:cytochrome b561